MDKACAKTLSKVLKINDHRDGNFYKQDLTITGLEDASEVVFAPDGSGYQSGSGNNYALSSNLKPPSFKKYFKNLYDYLKRVPR